MSSTNSSSWQTIKRVPANLHLYIIAAGMLTRCKVRSLEPRWWWSVVNLVIYHGDLLFHLLLKETDKTSGHIFKDAKNKTMVLQYNGDTHCKHFNEETSHAACIVFYLQLQCLRAKAAGKGVYVDCHCCRQCAKSHRGDGTLVSAGTMLDPLSSHTMKNNTLFDFDCDFLIFLYNLFYSWTFCPWSEGEVVHFRAVWC